MENFPSQTIIGFQWTECSLCRYFISNTFCGVDSIRFEFSGFKSDSCCRFKSCASFGQSITF